MENYFDKYVRLIVKVGLNIQPGQKLVIASPVDCAEFTRKVSLEAYQAGAKDVIVRWVDDASTRIKYLNAPDEVFDEFPKWTKTMMDTLSKEGAAYLAISAADPEALLGVDHDRIKRFETARKKALKNFSKRTMGNEIQWSVVSIPTESWAKKVFPKEKTVARAVEKLWEAIYHASRIDDNDAVENWVIHKNILKKRNEILNNYNFKYLKYKNSIGTDLEIELPRGHVWCGGEEKTKKGIYFMANIPTEEVFTAPKRNGINGKVVSTKPLVYNGNLIENFSVEFKAGKVVSVQAEKNQVLLEQLISSAKNADYLGEVALVPYNSPISNSKVLFYNTLYDENASCHLAFGKAYPDCVKDTEGKSDEELMKMGVNCSLTHADFMVGSEDLSIVGVTQEGKEVAVFVDGNFAF